MRYVRDNGGLSADHSYFEKVVGERFIKDLIESIEEDSVEDMQGMGPVEVGKIFIATRF